MMEALGHRGPDSSGHFVEGDLGLGFQRLGIVDLEHGDQPMFNEDRSVVMICNGEIFNFRELRTELAGNGHRFRSTCDVEVIVHLYEEYGIGLTDKLNGQFAFALFDRTRGKLILARDHFGIVPLFYTVVDGVLVFASEIKGILPHPAVTAEVDLVGLDQVLTFPGLVSPRTLFRGIESLGAGHSIQAGGEGITVKRYWDLDYPADGDLPYDRPESYYVNELRDRLQTSVRRRMQADVPVGVYLSGGLDSSLIAAMMRRADRSFDVRSFSVSFQQADINESKYQRLMSRLVESSHHEIPFDWSAIAERLAMMVYHAECPVKETYNTCSMALSEATRAQGVKVILACEGADELFGGYPGYRFDALGERRGRSADLDALLEAELRGQLWGSDEIFYERDYFAFREMKNGMYSSLVMDRFHEVDALSHPLIDREMLRGRARLHQRSYLDIKLRLADHLLGDHGDRMALANAVEVRYPFLDRDLVEFARFIPHDLKVRNLSEKYAVRKIAEGLVPHEIVSREKFGFRAPGSPYLLQQKIEWINDLLSYDRIARQGYFDPDVVERLKLQYSNAGHALHPHLEDDFLLVVLTFGILLDTFALPSLR